MEGGIKLKLLSLIQVDQRGGFFYQNGPVLTFFFLPLKLTLYSLKANFRTNAESRLKIH